MAAEFKYVLPIPVARYIRMRYRVAGKGKKAFVQQYMCPEYRDAQKEFREAIIKDYGLPEFPIARIYAGGKKFPAQRNVRLNVLIKLAGYSAVDKDNIIKFIGDSLQKEERSKSGSKTKTLVFPGIFENDWQIWDGRSTLLMYQGVDELTIEVTETIEPSPDVDQLDLWGDESIDPGG